MTDTELRRLAENATPGPWQYDGMTIDTRTYVEVVSATCAPCDYSGCSGARVDITDQDGRYIAAASPDVVIALLDRIKALEVERDRAIETMIAQVDHDTSERVALIDRAEQAEADRDARPAISREDAREWVKPLESEWSPGEEDALRRVQAAIRAHAAKGGE